jgi:hypothetical protein
MLTADQINFLTYTEAKNLKDQELKYIKNNYAYVATLALTNEILLKLILKEEDNIYIIFNINISTARLDKYQSVSNQPISRLNYKSNIDAYNNVISNYPKISFIIRLITMSDFDFSRSFLKISKRGETGDIIDKSNSKDFITLYNLAVEADTKLLQEEFIKADLNNIITNMRKVTFNTSIIIGNGFDKSLNLPTTYKEFIDDWIEREGHTELFFESLLRRLKLNNKDIQWIDLEDEIYSFYKTIEHEPNEFESFTNQYKSIKIELKNYLKRNSKIENYHTVLFHPICDVIKNSYENGNGLNFINFNYTNTVEQMINIATEFRYKPIDQFKLFHVHGDLEKDIVLGINDKLDVLPDFSFLHKLYDKHTNKFNLNEILNNSTRLYFYGFSFGASDETYYKEFFQNRCDPTFEENSKPKEIYIFYYGEPNHGKIYNRIREITGNKMDLLYRYNKVYFIDAAQEINMKEIIHDEYTFI